jgi:uncharacterized protein
MQYSQFNSLVPVEGNYALFNAFQQKVIFLEQPLFELLRAKVDAIDSLNGLHPDFYSYLIDQGFIVSDTANEVESVKELSNQVDNNDSTFFLTINPNMMCNFSCHYCYETHVTKSRMDSRTVERLKLFISRTIADPNLKYFPLAFFGGEPLLYFDKDVVPIIDHYSVECKSKGLPPNVGFTTNGYFINEEFVEYFQTKDVRCSLQITLDGFGEKHNQVRFTKSGKGSYDTIIRNIHLLVNNKFPVRVRINYTDQNVGDVEQVAEDFMGVSQEFREQYLLFDFHRVWQNDRRDGTASILAGKIQILRDLGFCVSSKYTPDNVKNSCYADKRNSVVINYNGDIYKCTARDFTGKSRAGYIDDGGRLNWEDGYLERRMSAKFNNPPCLTCRLLPMCNGGCSQHALEHLISGKSYCVYFGNEDEKDKVVVAKIKEITQGR